MSGSTVLWIVLAVVVVPALALLGVWWLRRGSSGRSLRQTGDRALARVIRVEALELPVGDAGIPCSISFQLEPLAGGRAFDRHKTMTLPQHRLPRVGDVWPAWYRSTDPAAFEVDVPDPGNPQQAGLFSEFGLRHPTQTQQPAAPGAAPQVAQRGDPRRSQPSAPAVTGDGSGRPPTSPTGARLAAEQTDRPSVQPASGQTTPEPSARPTATPSDAAAPTRSPQDDPVIELERLIRLHDNGSLTDEEFAAAKAKYLRG